MEFWGIEIKPGKPFKVEPEDGYVIHVSQVTLGDLKMVKEDENVPVYVTNGDDKNSELEEFMGQQCGALPSNEIKSEQNQSDSDEEDDESDSDEMGSDDDESDDEEAPLKVEPPSKKRPNGEAIKNTVASKKAKVAIQNKSSGGKKKCSFPCGSSCKN